MKKIIFFLFLLVFLQGCSKTSKVCFDSVCFDVETASSPLERTKGLMFQSSLEETQGMLFIFPESGLHSFWMKNTPLSLDIIWIDKDFKIVHTESSTTPNSETKLTPLKEAKYVLEINAGLTEKYNIKIRDMTKIPSL